MRLTLLQYGLHPETGIPAPGYLIQTDDGTNILVDTGFPAISEPDGAELAAMGLTEADHVLSQLALVGLSADDIDLLVCTHFDPDHCGGHDHFQGAELIVQRAHYEAARAEISPRLARHRARWDHPALRYRLIEGDVELVPGVTLIETGGHMPGHQSVLVRLPETGPVLLAIDAIPDHRLLDPAAWQPSPRDFDGPATVASIRKLADLIEREGVALTIFGHDAARWPELRKAPAFYG